MSRQKSIGKNTQFEENCYYLFVLRLYYLLTFQAQVNGRLSTWSFHVDNGSVVVCYGANVIIRKKAKAYSDILTCEDRQWQGTNAQYSQTS